MLDKGWAFRLMTVITLTAGTGFLMWLGEQITERGIGNGISLIIFAGIVARLPAAVAQTYNLYEIGQLNAFLLVALAALMVAVVAAIVFLESGRRKIPVQYAKRVIGRTGLWRAEHAHSVEDQYGRRHSAHICLVDHCVSCDHCGIF